MLGTVQTSRKVIGDWLKSEETNGSRWSRDNIEVAAGQGKLMTGTVLAKILSGGVVASLDVDNTGNGTIAEGALGAAAQQGTYRINFTSPTAFKVTAPDGSDVATGTVGTAFNTGGVAFTITAGATAFATGDQASITVAPQSAKYAVMDPAGSGAAAVAAGILIEDVDASGTSDVPGAALVRHAHIAPYGLTWKTGTTAAQRAAAFAQLATQGIFTVREA